MWCWCCWLEAHTWRITGRAPYLVPSSQVMLETVHLCVPLRCLCPVTTLYCFLFLSVWPLPGLLVPREQDLCLNYLWITRKILAVLKLFGEQWGLSLGRSGLEVGWVPRGTVTFSLYILLHCLEFEKENDLCVTMWLKNYVKRMKIQVTDWEKIIKDIW